ncbi:aminoacyl-tRNA hydrolase [Pseudoflavitalea sp. X16]|uniref:aminoacyl-tRNA hydrolase n=1 Tax=Paraflavitalea devenefica TaxID=2716334 RepID=UPI001421AB96|nr:aminoacyl-tRNA hydrolase [Paraflavitalea devenefica]NII25360.1 aminoacyl-tRNA hydrolase [Paraflavitalea devenefica]
MSKFLVIGLGNIGADYAGTRHNIGFDVADALARKHGTFFRVDRLAEVGEMKWKGKQLIIVKPTTYMNLSGKAVKYWMDKEKIQLDNLLVIVDELALPLSKVRLRASGSDAGHNGLKSIQETLLTDKYPRLRFGIGNNFPKGRQVDYVLGRWDDTELPLVKKKIEKCVEFIESFVAIGIERTMNEANKLEFTL